MTGVQTCALPILNLDLFSQSRYFNATVISSLSELSTLTWITAGVLFFVFVLFPAGSATTEYLRVLSGSV